MISLGISLLPSCSLIYGDSYEVTSTGENYYVQVIKGASKSYKKLKEDIPNLPIVVPGDDIRTKFDYNRVAQRYYLEKTKTIDVFVAPPAGNGHCRLARGNSPKELEDYGYSKHFVGYVKDDLKVYAREENLILIQRTFVLQMTFCMQHIAK